MEKFDFNDILITPEISTNIISRYIGIEIPHSLPIFTAPMDTVVNLSNSEIFDHYGINVVLPRTIKYDDIVNSKSYNKSMFISFGLDEINEILRKFDKSDYDSTYKDYLSNIDRNTKILIDVANGHMEIIVEYCKKIKEIRPDITIMIGNIANPETYTYYALQECVDYIRLGIGNGNGCLTTKNSGIGYPMASLIHETYKMKKFLQNEGYENLPKIVADGGMKDYSDIIKALNLGADYVMLGSIFNKAFESCAPNYLFGIKINEKLANFFFKHKFPVKKYFRGMSTKAVQKAMGKNTIKTSEGVVRYRKIEYYLEGWVQNFNHYLRNAMSYSNAKTIEEFIGKANYCKITKQSYDRFNK